MDASDVAHDGPTLCDYPAVRVALKFEEKLAEFRYRRKPDDRRESLKFVESFGNRDGF